MTSQLGAWQWLLLGSVLLAGVAAGFAWGQRRDAAAVRIERLDADAPNATRLRSLAPQRSRPWQLPTVKRAAHADIARHARTGKHSASGRLSGIGRLTAARARSGRRRAQCGGH